MPQIRCPNCGTTINLEARKQTDYKLIVGALRKSPKTFTDLLNITHLPRKTLSLRLTALCNTGIIVKDGGYRLNGSDPLKYGDEKMFAFEGGIIKKPSFLIRRNVLTTLMLLVIIASVAATVSAMFYRPQPPAVPTQKYVSTFKMDLKILEGTDVYAYQVMIYFNPSELDVLKVDEGDYLRIMYPATESRLFTYVNDIGPGKLSIFGTLLGDKTPVSGTGVLAIITFGVKSEGTPQSPYIAYNDTFPTVLRNSKNQNTAGTLTIEMEG